MKRTFALAFAVAAGVLLSGAPAHAEDGNYTPVNPNDPTLAGSIVSSICHREVPWIDYNVVLTDPDSRATAHTARLVLTDGTNTATLTLGELTNNQLSGRILWPGASADANGVGTGWPGWAFTNGSWVQTADNFAWTRNEITARIVVNPEIAVGLAYPIATPSCSGPAASGQGSSTQLAATGASGVMLPIAVVGGALVLAGAAFVVTRRIRRR